MSDEPMTKGQVESLLKIATLEFTTVLKDSLDEFAKEQKEEHRLSREATFEQATGYSWDKRGVFKGLIVWVAGAKKSTTVWRNVGIGAIIVLGVKSFWKDITG